MATKDMTSLHPLDPFPDSSKEKDQITEEKVKLLIQDSIKDLATKSELEKKQDIINNETGIETEVPTDK